MANNAVLSNCVDGDLSEVGLLGLRDIGRVLEGLDSALFIFTKVIATGRLVDQGCSTCDPRLAVCSALISAELLRMRPRDLWHASSVLRDAVLTTSRGCA